MEKKRLIEIILKFARNYVILKAFKKFLKDYQEWKIQTQSSKPYAILHLPDEKVDLIPYYKVQAAIQVLKLRGGSNDFAFWYAIYKLINLAEKRLVSLIPIKFMPLLLKYQQLRQRFPQLKLLEEIVTVCLSIGTALKSVEKGSVKNPEKIFRVDVFDEETVFKVFNQLGVNDDLCDNYGESMIRLLSSKDFDDEGKLQMFELWVQKLIYLHNGGEMQALLLCIIGVLFYFYHRDYRFFLLLIELLEKMVKKKTLFEKLLKFILKRLAKLGVKLVIPK